MPTQSVRKAGVDLGNPQQILAEDLEQKTVVSDEFRDVFLEQGDRTTAYLMGHGEDDKEVNTGGFSDLDLVASGNGALTAGDNIDGKVRYAIYRDSNREQLAAISGTFPLSSLRSAVASDRTAKILIALLGRVDRRIISAGDDQYLTLQVKTDSASDGAEIDPSASDQDLGIAYTELKR